MAQGSFTRCRIAGISTCVPDKLFDNIEDSKDFPKDEVRKVVAMAGIKRRHVSDGSICSTDLCLHAARQLMAKLEWPADSIDALIFITQTPDYFLPSSACLLHRDLGLNERCATFDVGLGCSGYPYGLWLASMMLNSGLKRVLVLHGETPSLITSAEDRATHLLFGDAGSATALEFSAEAPAHHFCLHTDGGGYDDLIIRGGGFRQRFPVETREYYLHMDGPDLFNFTIRRVPQLISDTLTMARQAVGDIDYYIFHQSNQFMMKHLVSKCGLPAERTPIILENFGNCGGPSVPLAITQAVKPNVDGHAQSLMLLGYGVGLSWSSALVTLDADAALLHSQLSEKCVST